MARITERATVMLEVNGKQAEANLKQMEAEAAKLKAALDAASDPKRAKQLRNEYQRLCNQIERNRTAISGVRNALENLDSATPKQLSKAIRALRRELDNIPPGTQVWREHCDNLRTLQERLDAVRGQMRVQESMWSRFNGWLNNCQTALLGATAALTGLVMAGRSAVDKFASMDQEMANVRKFTGMTAEEVDALNEEFKKIDTRSSREQLNQLAQEAGRLGKTSQEDVLGFVRAADKINVALDDLGDGATLTLSKLTGIFGDEERLGTEQALLSVGSVINELSQNCSASAPYLAEFASRIGGVGAQAKMTVQQIMGFAAVLDSNEQQVEASSTALAQVITRIYTDPAKYARAAGMDVDAFAKLVKEDMNAALIELLSTLNRAGGMDMLSPMFKDMGETGARAISALSTLATHIDQVKSQQEVANQAFAEATSIDKEFAVQNGTVQAELDKAKKRVGELAVELGQKLQPVMRLFISSSSAAMRLLSTIISFIAQHKDTVIAVTAAIVAYNAVILIHNSRIALAAKMTALFNGALSLMKGIIPALRLLFVPLVNVVQYFTNGLSVNYAMQLRWRKAMEAMRFTHWTGLILALAAAVYLFTKRLADSRTAAKEARDTFSNIEKEAQESAATQIKLLDELYKRTQDQTLAQDQRIKAIERLRSIYPAYFKDLTNEAFLAGRAADAYKALRDSILESARAKGRENKIAALEEEIQDLETKKDEESRYWVEKRLKIYFDTDDPSKLKNNPDYRLAEWNINAIEAKYQEDIDSKKSLQESLAKLNANYEINNAGQSPAGAASGLTSTGITSSGTGTGSGGGGRGSAADRFETEKAWREKEEALSRIAYATGESSYLDHTRRMDEIAVEFYKKQLDHTDLDAAERLKITAELREAEKKLREDDFAKSEDDESVRYNRQMALLKQSYLDGSISRKTYDMKVEEAELEHQRRLVAIFEEGTDKKLAAEKRLQDLLLQQMERRKKETERLEKEIADARMKYFGLSQSEKDAKFAEEIDALDLAYDQMKSLAGDNADEMERIDKAYLDGKRQLEETYNQQSAESTGQSYKGAIAKSAEWLQGEGGQALSGSLNVAVSGMSSIFSQLSSLIQAETEIQTAAIEKRYEAEVNAAQGNSYRIAKAEKKKEAEIAKVKNEANRKLFAMQVIQAVAQTAQNALAAYGSAAQVPVVGYILAPIAAAMAVAAGAIQIAAIKKQQAASSAQGYAEGGFTRPGGKYEPAGIVHAGEWVASQKLVNSPVARPVLEALDYAQKHNTIGRLRESDISRSITAPAALTRIAESDGASLAMVESALRTNAAIARLNERLDEPFVTINTVTGDSGIKAKQDEYNALMNNITPKSKRS